MLFFIYYNGDNMELDYENISKDSLIIDIRHPEDYKLYHLKNSINIQRIKLMKNPKKYLNNKINYIICDKGFVSISCVKILNALGYNCMSVKGGIDAIKNM